MCWRSRSTTGETCWLCTFPWAPWLCTSGLCSSHSKGRASSSNAASRRDPAAVGEKQHCPCLGLGAAMSAGNFLQLSLSDSQTKNILASADLSSLHEEISLANPGADVITFLFGGGRREGTFFFITCQILEEMFFPFHPRKRKINFSTFQKTWSKK